MANIDYAIYQQTTGGSNPGVVVYLKFNYLSSNGSVSGNYDYTKSGTFPVPTGGISAFTDLIRQGQTPQGGTQFPAGSIPVITDPSYVIFAIDGPAYFRKNLDAITTDDSVQYEYYNLTYVLDDGSTLSGNNLQPIVNPPSSPCHIMYFSAISPSTKGQQGQLDDFNLYLNLGKIDPCVKNNGRGHGN